MPETLLAIAIVVAIVGLAGFYVYKAKKRGQKCIGCPHAKQCGRNACSCGCGEQP